MKFYFQSRALFFSCLPLLSPAALAQPVQDHIKPLNWIIQLKQHDHTVQPRYAPDLWHTGWRHSQSQSSGLYTESAAEKCGAQIQATNESIVSDPQFLHMICKNFQKAFTEEEAQAYIAFLSTPMGQSINQKSAGLLNSILHETMTLNAAILNDSQQSLNEKLASILQPLLLSN